MAGMATRIRDAIAAIEVALPRVDFGWREGADPSAVDAAESEFGDSFPIDVREMYLLHDGQRSEPGPVPMIGDTPMRLLDRSLELWRFQQAHDLGAIDHLAHDDEVNPAISDPRWWPLGFYDGKETVFVDLNPATAGREGQLVFARAWLLRIQWIAPSLVELLEAIARSAASGFVTTVDCGPDAGGVRLGIGPGPRHSKALPARCGHSTG